MRAFTKAYHQRFISHGKVFNHMNEEEITQFFQILHREEEETKPKGTSKAEGYVKGTGNHATSKTHKDNYKARNNNNSCTHNDQSSERRHTQKISNQCAYCPTPQEWEDCYLHNYMHRKYRGVKLEAKEPRLQISPSFLLEVLIRVEGTRTW